MINRGKIFEMQGKCERVLQRYKQSLNGVFIYWLITYVVLAIDVFPLIIAFQIEQYFIVPPDKEWMLFLPLTVLWAISLICYCVMKRLKHKLNEELKAVYNEYEKTLICLNKVK